MSGKKTGYYLIIIGIVLIIIALIPFQRYETKMDHYSDIFNCGDYVYKDITNEICRIYVDLDHYYEYAEIEGTISGEGIQVWILDNDDQVVSNLGKVNGQKNFYLITYASNTYRIIAIPYKYPFDNYVSVTGTIKKWYYKEEYYTYHPLAGLIYIGLIIFVVGIIKSKLSKDHV